MFLCHSSAYLFLRFDRHHRRYSRTPYSSDHNSLTSSSAAFSRALHDPRNKRLSIPGFNPVNQVLELGGRQHLILHPNAANKISE